MVYLFGPPFADTYELSYKSDNVVILPLAEYRAHF